MLRLACAPKGPLADALTDVTSELVNLGVCCLYSVLNTRKRVKWVFVWYKLTGVSQVASQKLFIKIVNVLYLITKATHS